jgi:hexulose-6-phosphate isomerase
VRKALIDVGYSDTLTAEIGFYASDPLQAVYDTARQLNVILGDPAG